MTVWCGRVDGPPILATSSTAGTIAVWDLNAKGKLLHTIRDAHEAGVTGLQFVGGLLISSAGDNGVKVRRQTREVSRPWIRG